MQTPNDDTSLLRKIEISTGTVNSNNVLSDPAREVAKTVIQDTKHLPVPLDQEIDILIAGPEAASEPLSNLHVAVAPHTRLPPEILAVIFVHTLDAKPLVFPPNTSQTSWTLRKVCSTWRFVALNEPSLWNHIEIYEANIRSHHRHRLVSLIQNTLPPAGPLSISFNNRTYFDSMDTIRNAIVPNLQRLKDLAFDITLPTFTEFLKLLRTPHEDLCSLESMTINIWRGWRPDDGLLGITDCVCATAFRQATRLKKLHLDSDSETLHFRIFFHLPLRWDGLTSLRLTTYHLMPIADAHCILLRCSSLVDLMVSLCDGNGEHPRGTPEMSQALNLPHLREVQLDGDVQQPHSVLDLLIPWGQLNSLDINGLQTVTLPEALNIFRRCTQLEKLSITIGRDRTPSVEMPKEIVTRACLRFMKICNYSTGGDILDSLSLPVLETLLLKANFMPAESAANMISRSTVRCPNFHITALLNNIIRGLLTHMPHLEEFNVPRIALHSSVMEDIANGSLLLSMRQFSCHLNSLRSIPLFVKILERGRKQKNPASAGTGSAAAPLQKVLGTYTTAFGKTCTRPIRETIRRTEDLNEEYNTRFELVCLDSGGW